MLHNTAGTKEWTTKWPYIANAVFRIIEMMVNKLAFVGFKGSDRPPHWIRPGMLSCMFPALDGPRVCFRSECCIGGKSMAASRVNCSFAPTRQRRARGWTSRK